MLKRLFDIVFSALGVLLLLPVLAAVAIAIRYDSPGPIFFRQIRVGRDEKLFKIYKFRTMTIYQESNASLLTVSNDQRITRIGRYIRLYKIDELPQLINVLLGDMSIVGPRPEVPEYVAYYPEIKRDVILSVRPGITDWASVFFKDENLLLNANENSLDVYKNKILPRKVEFYVHYVQNQSFFGDLKIIFFTVIAILGISKR